MQLPGDRRKEFVISIDTAHVRSADPNSACNFELVVARCRRGGRGEGGGRYFVTSRTDQPAVRDRTLHALQREGYCGFDDVTVISDGAEILKRLPRAIPNPSQRFAGAQFLFDEWRDPNLTGLEIFQRALDWASLYELPISKTGCTFTLRTFQNTRIANFHTLMVQRVADRIDAHLVLDKPKGGKSQWYQLGGTTFTTPRMIAAHYALAIAFGRMLDETRLTGQTTFRAEFDLTAERRISIRHCPIYPVLPGASKARCRKSCFRMEEARKRKEDYETNLPLHRKSRSLQRSLERRMKR